MPTRATCLAIVLYWLVAAGGLLSREVLPDLLSGSPPDMRSISLAEEVQPPKPVKWRIQVEEEAKPGKAAALRQVGEVTTLWSRTEDGGFRLDTDTQVESESLLKSTPFPATENVRLMIPSHFLIDPGGNLVSFQAKVSAYPDPKPWVTLDGEVNKAKKTIDLKTKSIVPMLAIRKSLPYEPRGMIQSSIGPIDRLPGLRIGQRWKSKVVDPLSGRIESMQVEVARNRVIQWGANPVTVLEVVQSMSSVTARTWVRPDGLVIRQEMPLPFVKILIERVPE